MVKRRRKFRSSPGVAALVVGLVLLGAVNLLPPDTSLELVQEAGVLRVCVPSSYPPLVTGDSANPGFDISVLQEIANRMKLRLAINVVPAMGRDFNPRNWRITRASCEVVAGGVTTSDVTRSFLETIPTGIENSWVLIAKPGDQLGQGKAAGVFPGFSGLDRSKLSAYLRGLGVQITLDSSADQLVQDFKAGRFDMAVAGALDARQVTAALPGLTVTPLPEDLGRYDFGFGLWKGDLTLKRELLAQYEALDRNGFLAQERDRYALLPTVPPSS